MKNEKMLHIIIRVPKEESAFTYFQLEANEGLCFYSTLKESLGAGYRDIDILGHISLKNEVLQLIETLKTKYPVNILLNEEIFDQKDIQNI